MTHDDSAPVARPDGQGEHPPTAAWLAHCRPGFESTAAGELDQRARAAGLAGVYAVAREGEGFLRLVNADPDAATAMATRLPGQTVFCRQLVREWHWLTDLPAQDRVSPIVDCLPRNMAFRGFQISVPDTNEGKQLARFVRGFRGALARGLQQAGIALDRPGAPRLHFMFPDSSRVSIGINLDPEAPPGGVWRMRMPAAAPSRSTLKLEEALKVLLDADERAAWLQPGMSAADLGASPGGWTWQMVRRHIHVYAVDNGPMDANLMDSGLVTHVRADGFSWRPERPVDWLLCDIVDKPARVADRMATWLEQGWARHALFNLKLPMKRIWPFVDDVLSRLSERTTDLPGHPRLRARQLYHDRDEITVAILRDGN